MKKMLLILVFVSGISRITLAETVQIYFNKEIPQLEFAANDIKVALEQKGFIVDLRNISGFNTDINGKKVILGLASDNDIISQLKAQGGRETGHLSEQAYALRTTTKSGMCYWILGGDNNGTMYGGLQMAENINFNGFGDTYDMQESPAILKRGIKLNLPFDRVMQLSFCKILKPQLSYSLS